MSGTLEILRASGLRDREPELYNELVASIQRPAAPKPLTLLYQGAGQVKFIGLFASREHAYQMLSLANGMRTQVAELQVEGDGL